MTTDRNLLFAVLAFQNEYLTLSQLVAICRAWSSNHSRPLADLMVEWKWIDPAARAELNRLTERKLARYGGDARMTLSAVTDQSVRDAIRDVDDPGVRQTLAGLQPSAGHVLVSTIDPPAENRTRYTLSRLHGEGGLGRVWVARDGDLNREVALKELRPERGVNVEASCRFLMEAQVTGQLEHPNIVPVYELSRRPDDKQPFYTMRFVRGQTLREAISSYHKRSREQQPIDPLEQRRLLGALVSVCNAMAYAHSRGVVHRDLKPDNIILGAFGEVLVLDWGLAKLMDQESGPQASTVDVPVALSPAADGERTAAGRVMGTPAYMAPEQAEGRSELIDSRTDIYGLGAILFEILAGRPPHEGKGTAAILHRIISSDSPRARSVAPAIAAPLDAICAMAMAKGRADRYRSASELGEDLQRWLADEPARAYRETAAEKMARWTRRHRSAMLAAMAILLVIAVSSVTAAIWIQGARQREIVAREQAESAGRAEAEARQESRQLFKGFRSAVDTLLTTVGEGLEKVPGAQEVRRPLLEQAAAAYVDLVTKCRDDPELQLEATWTLIRLARGRLQLGDFVGAESDAKAAQATFSELLEFAKQNRNRRYAFATSVLEVGLIYADLGRNDLAPHCIQSAVEMFSSLANDDSGNTTTRDALGNSLVHWGQWLADSGRFDEADQALTRAVSVYESVVDSAPGEPRFRVGLATSQKALGQLMTALGRDSADASLVAAVNQCRRLVELIPDVPEYRERLAATRQVLAQYYLSMGHWSEADREFGSAIDELRRLSNDDPQVLVYLESLAATTSNRAVALRLLGEFHESEQAIRQALASYEEYQARTLSAEPTVAYRSGHAGCQITLGQLLRDRGETATAEELLRAAIDAFQRLLGDDPDRPTFFQQGIAVARASLGDVLFQAGRANDAKLELTVAIVDSRTLTTKHPEAPEFADTLARTSQRLGEIQFAAGLADEAAQSFRESITTRERLARQLPHIPDHNSRLAWALATCPVESLRNPPRAVDLAASATTGVPDNGLYQSVLGAAYYRAGNWNSAKRALEQALELRPKDNPATAFLLALCHFRLDAPEQAGQWFDRGCEWMRNNRASDLELIFLRNEAERVLSRSGGKIPN